MPDADPSGRPRKALATATTYFAEGLPWSLLHQVAGEFFTAVGLSATQVGRTSYLHAGTTFKVLVSPVVDWIGTLRGWMIAMQVAMGAVVGGLALLAVRSGIEGTTLALVWLALAALSFLSATHDIACDGYYMEMLGARDQARYSGLRVAAFRLAMLVGSGGIVFVGGHVAWTAAFALAAGLLVALAAFHACVLPVRRRDGEADEERRSAGHVRAAYVTFLSQPKVVAVVAFLVAYKMSDAIMFSMSKVLLARSLGVPTDVRGMINVPSILAAIVGAGVGGAWISRVGLARALWPITLLMASTQPLYALMAEFADQLAVGDPASVTSLSDLDPERAMGRLVVIGSVVVIEQFCGGLATAAQMVFIMRRCHPDHKAAHFAFATAIYSTAQMLVGGESGTLFDAVGPANYFWIASALAIPAILLVPFVPKDEA